MEAVVTEALQWSEAAASKFVERAEQLKQLMYLQIDAGAKERLQVLFWLKS